MNDTWVLIPANNEGRSIGAVISGCRAYCRNILVVDDGSNDSTGRIAAAAGAQVIRHDSNKGKGAALRTGFRMLLDRGCRVVITLDADGQHDPREIPRFLSSYERIAAEEKREVIVIGSRIRGKERIPLYRAVPHRIGEFFISLAARRHIPDTQSGYRLYTRGILEAIECSAKRFDMEAEILIKASRKGVRIEQIPIEAIYRENYTTHFRPVVDFYRISIMVLKNLFK